MSQFSGYNWIKVKRHVYDPTKSWSENYKALEAHHIEETNFLIETLRSFEKAGMAKLADAEDSKSSAARRVGSSPSTSTKFI